MAITLEAGDAAPDFALPDQEGTHAFAGRIPGAGRLSSTSIRAMRRRVVRPRPAPSGTVTPKSRPKAPSCSAFRKTMPIRT